MQTRSDKTEADATILRLPEVRLGSLHLQHVGALGITASAPPFPPVPGESAVQGDFFDWYSKKSPAPVIGWLGGNVLKGFRVTIDFPNRMTYWERESELDAHDLDQVGVTPETRDRKKDISSPALRRKRASRRSKASSLGTNCFRSTSFM